MKDFNIKQKLSNNKGITLIALTITVVIMMIIVGISVNVGTDSLDSTRLQGFYTQLEIIQKRVDDIVTTNEGYYTTNEQGTRIYVDIKSQGGSDVTSSQIAFLQGILAEEELTNIPASEFRYFTIADLEEQLDLSEIDSNVFIHFASRTIISEEGIKVKEKTYHILKNNMYFVDENITKNQGTLELTYDIKNYGSNSYKITVMPNKIGDLNTHGILRYKKTTTKYWETASGLEIVINELTEYNIEYVDNNKNIVSEIITVELDENNLPIVVVNE